MADILIIDDDEMLCDLICRYLRQKGHGVGYEVTLGDGLTSVMSRNYDVVFLDVGLPDGNGLDALPKIRELPSPPEVIIFTAESEPDGAEIAIRWGAWDYIQKPPSVKALTLPLVRALQYRDEKKKRPRKALRLDNIIASGPRMKGCLDLLAEAANSRVNVLITGDTGTGKELFARALHENSERLAGSFVVVDCAALPETLVESMLFGHEKGAFTGADKASAGLITQAHGGTLFLDEVGELPLPVQKSFLRVLQERRFRPVGAGREIKSDFRLVAATNRDLDQEVQSGRFRNDLLFRLKSFVIPLPPLTERREDIRSLSLFHVARACERYGMEIKGFSPEFLDSLSVYEWPGNVRELVNTLDRAISAAWHEPTLHPKHLPVDIRIELARALMNREMQPEADPQVRHGSSGTVPKLRDLLEDTKRRYFQKVIFHAEGDVREACRISGLSRSTLYENLKKFNMTLSR